MDKNKYAFIDRDGTLIFEPQDTFQIDSLDKLKILNGVIEGLQIIKKFGYKLIMVSNQDGLGTASFPEKDFEIPHNKMLEIFKEHDIEFDKILICPHFSTDNCNCRKPKLGLIKDFLEDIDSENSFVCGNSRADSRFAINIGIRFVSMQTNGSFEEIIKALG